MKPKKDTKFVREINVDICPNDPVDIRCGGAATLGFDYTVLSDRCKEAMETINSVLKSLDVKPMGISSSGKRKVLATRKTWTPLGIKRNMNKEFKNWLLSEYKRRNFGRW